MAEVPLEVRISLLRQHGSFTQAYSATFQPGLAHFGDKQGFIAYRRMGGTALVLSDPVAPPSYAGDLIKQFLACNPDAAFCQVSRRIAELLAPLGFLINETGPENRIDLAQYDFSGRAKQNLRSAMRRMPKLGYVTRESTITEVGANKIGAVSEAWRRRRTVRRKEIGFLNRPFVLAEEPDVRMLFTFDAAGKLLAFAVFDPIFEQGRVVGYTSQHNRHLPEADTQVQQAIRCQAIELFRSEGKKWLFLGLSPFADIHDKNFRHDWLTRRAFRFAYENTLFNRFLYPSKSLHVHKRQFRGSTEQTYYAFNRTPSLPRILKLLRACNIL
jgi:lysylphosphatidylglycerol synthetase-like protein (DUF2156 family)